MNKSESKYFNTARRIDEAFLSILEKKDLEYITVKEICKKADVNRSTFYLHYETINDLLNESADYVIEVFLQYYKDLDNTNLNVDTSDLIDLYLISPRYVKPYLEFIKDHYRLFEAFVKQNSALPFKYTYKDLYENIIDPIMNRFNVPDEKKKYINTFYMQGVLAVVKEWIKEGCKESIDFITETIDNCMFPTKITIRAQQPLK